MLTEPAALGRRDLFAIRFHIEKLRAMAADKSLAAIEQSIPVLGSVVVCHAARGQEALRIPRETARTGRIAFTVRIGRAAPIGESTDVGALVDALQMILLKDISA